MKVKTKGTKHKHNFALFENKNLNNLKDALIRWYVLIPLIGITGILFLVIGIELFYAQRVFPGVYIDDIQLGSKNYTQVLDKISESAKSRQASALVFRTDQAELFVIESSDGLVDFDENETVMNALKVGHEGSYWNQWRDRVRALRDGVRISPVLAYDRDVVYRMLDEKLNRSEQKALDAQFVVKDSTVAIVPGKTGLEVNKDKLIDELGHYWSFTRKDNQFKVDFEQTLQEISERDLQPLLSNVQGLLDRTLVVSSTELYREQFQIKGTQLFSLLSITKNDSQGVVLMFDDYKVAEQFRELAEKLRRDPQDAQFQLENGRAVVFQPSQDGTVLDTQLLAQALLTAALDPSLNANIEAPLKRTPPAISTASVNEYGIREKIATGRSTFRGSAAGRVHNVVLASQKLNGVLIAPGEVFSMYKTVGEIEKETGFKDAFIIKDGRTIPGVGGGVCQVSTTLFRAVLDAGLPIVERKAHAYRVYYYEQDSAPGIDAAVYFPSWDFKFKNDTGNYLLLETIVDAKKLTAEFNLYGVSDGRTVTMTKPLVGAQTPPPPDLYVEDPNLKRGTTVQDDHAAWGATVSFDRTVMKDGQQLYKDTFKSAYKAWQAVFRVGTKDN